MQDVRWVKGGSGRGASTLELFFDLVYVFAITQVAALMQDEPNLLGLTRGAVIMWLLWWTWSIYTWMTNWLGTEGTGIRLALLGAMGATLMVAQTVPDAFTDGAAWFGLTYLVVRLIAAALYWWSSRDVPGQRAALLTFLPLSLTAAAVVFVGGLVPVDVRSAVWIGAVILDLVSALAAGRGRWAMDAHHFAERNGLFVIIALGESIVAIGLGAAAGDRTSWGFVALAASFAAAAALWWSYFDRFAPYAEDYFERAGDKERGRFARDAYTIFHFPLVLGIVMFAVGAEEVVVHPLEVLSAAARASLAVGTALVLLALVLGLWRVAHRLSTERLLAALALVLLAVLGDRLSGVAFMAVVVAIVATALTVERSYSWPETEVGATTP